MADERTIPLLPCISLDETLDFYRTLGFEVTHEQSTPYVYAAMRRGEIYLQFHGQRRLNPEKSAGACLVFVSEVGPYHRAFADALRAGRGKIPTAGFPRLTRLMKGQTRFSAFDPSGNRLLFIDRDEPPIDYGKYEAKPSKLATAIDNAAFLRDTYCNDKAAAHVLDKAIDRDELVSSIDLALALAARAELAVAMGDADRALAVRTLIRRLPLSRKDRERHRDELEAADALERWIG
jgi:catechol 2,3-dioxygenase-like lactoylglutathione lyase family enzyme